MKDWKSKSGVLYQIAYGYLPKYQQPNTINICRFVWRLPFSALVVWPFLLTALVFSVTTITLSRLVATALIIPLFGFKPTIKPWDIDENFLGNLQPIQRWPKLRGRNVPPILFIAVAGIGWTLYRAGALFYRHPRTTALTLLTLVCLVGIPLVIAKMKNSSWWQMMREYAKAKKAKACPMITFTD